MIKLLSLFLFFALLSPHISALQIPQATENNPLTWTNLSLSTTQVKAGDRIPVKIQLSLLKGFYAYDDKLKLFPLVPDGMRVSELTIKPLAEFTDFSGRKHQGVIDNASLEFFIEIPQTLDQPLNEIIFDIEYVACTPKYCLPKHKLEIKAEVNIESARPSSFIEEKISDNLFLAFFFVFIFGFLTSLTPCVYPLIPITLAVIGARTKSSSKLQAFSLSFVYVLGIAVTYSLLGIFAAKTGALFGQALSYPPVVLAFAALFMLMALSIYGYFEIQIPHFISHRLNQTKSKTGFVGAFTTGLIAGVVASPCVGPVLVGVLAYIAKSQNSLLGFSLLFTFAMGMGVLFLFIGTFSSLFQKLPRSGGWMDIIKFILGSTLLGVALYYLKPILPEGWFAICTVLLLLAALFSFYAKIYPKTAHKAFHFLPIIFCVFAFISPVIIQLKDTSTTNETKAALKNGWQYYSAEKIEEAKTNHQPVIIDFFADWCAACMELDEKTFSTEKFISASKRFMLLKVDATETFPELADLQKTYEVYGLPTIIFVDSQGQMVRDATLTGFEETEPFLKRMDGVK